MNTAVLYPGDKADMMLTFYSGQKYRLLVCSQEQLGDVAFRILDIDRNEVYNFNYNRQCPITPKLETHRTPTEQVF